MALSGGLRAAVAAVAALGVAGSAALGGAVGWSLGRTAVDLRALLEEGGPALPFERDGLPFDTGELPFDVPGDDAPGGPSGDPDAGSAAAAYAAPRPDRPVVELDFDVADDLSEVTGTERVVFTPDRRVCELVFRLWPNSPATAVSGTRLAVSGVEVDGETAPVELTSAGAAPSSPGTLLEVPVDGCVDPGEQVRAVLDFTLTLGEDAAERVGWSRTADMAWFATAFPLLAWEHGHGWMREPAVDIFGESAGSEAFDLTRLQVTAPQRYAVQGTGRPVEQRTGDGRTSHRFAAPSVRDIAVVVGDLEVVTADVAAGAGEPVRLHVAMPAAVATAVDARRWLQVQSRWLGRIAGYLGPYPYSDLWVSVVPTFPTGVEFPGAVFYGDVDPAAFPQLVPHETAHMWFYGLVGNNQGRDPWLDEGMASFVEAVAIGSGDLVRAVPVPPDARGRLGRPMTWWAEQQDGAEMYGAGVYQQGAKALLEARAAAGAQAFDAALRQYVRDGAHRIARPSDVQAAFGDLPGAVAALQDAGAFARSGPGTSRLLGFTVRTGRAPAA